jgi:microcystin-dependent protein
MSRILDEYLGMIKLFAGPFIPEGYLECNGQLVSKKQEEVLYALIGTIYGGDEDTEYFGIPKLTSPDENVKYIICIRGIFPYRY